MESDGCYDNRTMEEHIGTAFRKLTDLQMFMSEIDKAYGSRIAYRYFEKDLIVDKTFSDLTCDVKAIASWMVGKGYCGKHIAVLGPTSYQWITTFMGIACSANVVLPIDKMLSKKEILNIFELGDVEVVFASADFESLLCDIENDQEHKREVVRFNGDDFQEILGTAHVQLPKTDPEALAEILFTSGTTGVSKGVMLSQKNIAANLSAYHKLNILENISSPPVALSVLPVHHTYELTIGHLGMLCLGITVCINDRLENILANINTFKPAILLVVPTIAEAFYKKIQDGISSSGNRRKIALADKLISIFRRFNIDVRRKLYKNVLDKFGGNLTSIVVGGAALRREVAEFFEGMGVNMFQGYGLTECAPLVASNCPKENRLGSVGKPIDCMQVKIEDGEIVVKGDCVMLGYYKNAEATAEAITAGGWLHTGDLGYLDEDGYLYITGRSKNLIILGNGKNIYPEELESLLLTIEGVKDVMVYDQNGKICAAIHPESINDTKLKNQIKKGLNEINATLPSYKKIVAFDFISKEFPKTTTLKIKRKEALQMIGQIIQKSSAEFVPPVTPMQKKVVSVFEEILGRTNIGIKDDFFDMGGDSLAAMEAAQILGIQAQDIYTNSTPELLEKHLCMKDAYTTETESLDVNAILRKDAGLDWKMEPKCVLLTGATGFLGAHILRELSGKGVAIICLVRDYLKLNRILQYYFPTETSRFTYVTVEGDIEKPGFGLSDELYDKLAHQVDMVIHTAARVSHAGHYEEFERTNVAGTQNVIDFCKKAGAILQHTSTASVSGAGTVEQSGQDVEFDEFCLNIGQKYTQNVYIHSKYKAEELVLVARNEGLKANIFRIGNLTWRTSDGRFQINANTNGFVQRCRGLIKVGMYGENLADFPVDFTQVDACAEAYVKLCFHKKVNNVYHMYNPYIYSLGTLGKMISFKIRKTSQDDFKRNLQLWRNDTDVAVLAFYNSMASMSRNIPMSNRFTVDELKQLGFRWPKPGFRYLRHFKKIS